MRPFVVYVSPFAYYMTVVVGRSAVHCSRNSYASPLCAFVSALETRWAKVGKLGNYPVALTVNEAGNRLSVSSFVVDRVLGFEVKGIREAEC